MKPKKFLSILLIYTVISLISIRKLFDFEAGLGHNWDSPFSPLAVSYLSILKNLLYVWHGQLSLGFPIVSSISTKIWWLFNSIAGIALGGHLVSQMAVLLYLISGGLLMFCYVGILLKKGNGSNVFFAPFCAGLFFMFSPVIFGHIVGGAFNQLFTMIVSLLLLIVLEVGATRHKTTRTAIEISLVFILISVTLHNHLISAFITICYVLYLYDWPLKKKIELTLKTAGISLLLAIYWLLPTLYGLAQTNVAQKLKENISFGNLSANVPTLSNALFANGYVRRFYDFMVYDNLYPFWKITGLFLFLIIIASIFLVPRNKVNKSKYSLFWFGLFLIFINFATGFIGPFGPAVQFLYENFPPLSIFRSPQWWIMPLTICFSVLIGLSFNRLVSLFRPKLLLKIALLVLLTFVLHPFYLSGDLGIEKLYQRQLTITNWYKADHLDLYKIPADYKKAIEILAKDNSDSKVFLLPLSLSPYFEETIYQRQGSGVDPILAYLAPKPVIFNDINVEYDTKNTLLSPEKKLYYDHSKEFLNLLGVFNAKYIMYKKDYSPVFSDYRGYWEKGLFYRILMENIDQIGKVVIDGESTLLIELNSNYYWPHIYSPEKLYYIAGSSEYLTDIGELVGDNSISGVLFNKSSGGLPIFKIEEITNTGQNYDDIFAIGKRSDNSINPKTFDFMLNIPVNGIYEVYVKNNTRDQKWERIDERQFEEGRRKYTLAEKYQKPNLIDRLGFINGYQYDTSYFISFNYQAKTDKALLTVLGGEKEKVVNNPLPSTGREWVYYETVFRSLPSGSLAKVIISSASYKDLKVKIISEPQIVLRLKNIGAREVQLNPTIESTRINPTRYKVTVKNAVRPFVLIFSEAYHRGWKLSYNGKEISNTNHKIANGYANSWIVSPNDVNNQTEYDLVIEFWPQRLFYAGLAISLLTLVFCLVAWKKTRND